MYNKAKADMTSDDSSFRCLLCFQSYQTPRVLPCLHTFCLKCLDSYIQSESTETDKTFPCPACEKPTTSSCPWSPVNTWASFLPPPQDRDGSELLCGGCVRDGEETVADFWCRACGEGLCTPCKVAHRRNKATTDHKVAEAGHVAMADPDPNMVTGNESCPQHPNKTLEVYCLDHGVICCVLCLAISHRECKHVKSIDDISQSRFSYTSCVDKWAKLEAEAKRLFTEDASELDSMEKDKANLSSIMDQKVADAKRKLDTLNAKFHTDLVATHEQNTQKLRHHMKNAEQFHMNARNTWILMKKLESHESRRQAFIAREQASGQVLGHYHRLCHRVKDGHNVFRLHLQIEDIIKKLIDSVTDIGTVRVSSSLSSVTQAVLTSVGAMINSVNTAPTKSAFSESLSSSDMLESLAKLTLATSVQAVCSSDWSGRACLVKTIQTSDLGSTQSILLTGGTFVDGITLLIADCNNKRILWFDQNYKYVKPFHIDGCPTDVAKGEASGDLYVAVYNKEILKCSLASGHLTVVSRTPCPTLTCGVAWMGDRLLVGTSDAVKVLASDGQEVISVQIETRVTTCIAASVKHKTYYHRDGNSVVGRALPGQEVARYTHPELRDPVGISMSRDDHLIVCGYRSGNVHQVACDGSRGRILLEKLYRIKRPWAVIVHPGKPEFVVTSCQESVAFEVYTFCSE